MKVEQWLRDSSQKLEQAGIETARLDALILLEDELGLDRATILAELNREISPEQIAKLNKLLKRRAKHEPLAYIRGHSEFYGRNFVVTPAVLTPRPESETIIDLLGGLNASRELSEKLRKSGAQPNSVVKIADVGAGSGALGITAKLEFPDTQKITVDLLEIDPEALKIAKINVDKLTTGIAVIESDLLESAEDYYDILLVNLPYVPDDYQINDAAGFEPRIALFSGKDGLDLYRRLFMQLSAVQKRPLYLFIESFPFQHDEISKVLSKIGYALHKEQDFVQVFELMDNV